jgi:hypothetical protein
MRTRTGLTVTTIKRNEEESGDENVTEDKNESEDKSSGNKNWHHIMHAQNRAQRHRDTKAEADRHSAKTGAEAEPGAGTDRQSPGVVRWLMGGRR